MRLELPHTIAPGRLAKAGVRLEGQVALRRMKRLAGLLTNSGGAVDLELAFFRCESGLTRITGRYDTKLEVVCQRCLEPVTVKLARTINVGITLDGTADGLPASTEPLTLVQDDILLADFIEEEILLGLPISPMHDPQDCAAGELVMQHNQAASSPFKALEKLRKFQETAD